MKTKLTAIREQNLFAVYTNSDLTEGRGSEYVMALTQILATANRIGKGGYVQGCDCPVRECKAIYIEELNDWYAPMGLIQAPTDKDKAQEKVIYEQKVKTLLLEKFKTGEELTEEDRAKILKYLKK